MVIPTKNVGHLLKDCLDSVSWADEIIVVDMFSTDDTAAICRAFPQCRLLRREDYIFGNVNFGFDQATSEWVMRLDSDERITPELAAEIQGILADPPPRVTGFEFWERLIILGRELEHGFGRRHYRKMMFRRGTARYRVSSEHEDLQTSGVWQRCHQGYLHYAYQQVGQYLTKTNYYTDRDVERVALGSRAPSMATALREAARAFYLYYLKWAGYRDGWVGLVDAGMRAVYQFTYWAKLRERWERELRTPAEAHGVLDLEISVVNTDNRELLASCLGSLPAACEGLRWHATLVDNASGDGSREMVATTFPTVRVLQNQRRLGFSANHNQVIRPVIEARSARYVLVLNEDTELDPRSVHELVEFADAYPGVGAVGPRIRGNDGEPQASLFAFPTFSRQLRGSWRPGKNHLPASDTGWLNGSCLLLRTEALRRVGPLDERFFIFYEDTDLGLRLHRAGWQSAICERATILHHGHQTVSRPAFGTAMERQMRRSEYLFFRKHRGRVKAALLVAGVRMGLLMRAAKAVALGRLRRDQRERTNAKLFLDLAAYHPRHPLAHETAVDTALIREGATR